jgi:hypothetical protein
MPHATRQAPLIPELQLTANDAEALGPVFTQQPAGVRNAGALREQDVDWFRAAFCQPGAATATLNYYRAFIRFQTVSDKDDPIWA